MLIRIIIVESSDELSLYPHPAAVRLKRQCRVKLLTTLLYLPFPVSLRPIREM